MNLECLTAEEDGAYPDHGEKGGDGAKGGSCWCDVHDILREIKAVDGHIQYGENPFLPLRLLGFVCHGRRVRWLRGSDKVWRLWRKT